ncbi:Nip100p SCDLUD_002188 [Saccharomycodes ludwigii]|uniref:Nip100p n=1 Tax=Saccharomycodes ludwigii TaxID=36035 RepID=UPI001E84BB4F|nr:hypothetical protein SCDLUD_002188 [Saccharomycodes ludwigii]KAH3902368.1 hypothetical protein SCDLUD_002188 [Saccharomycodes ludwigii]
MNKEDVERLKNIISKLENKVYLLTQKYHELEIEKNKKSNDSTLEQQLEELIIDKETLEEYNAIQKLEIDNLLTKNQNLRQRLNTLVETTKYGDLTLKYVELQQTLNELSSKYTTLEKDKTQKIQEIDDLKSTIQVLESDLDNTSKELVTTLHKLDELIPLEDITLMEIVDKLTAENLDLSEKIELLYTENEKIQTQLCNEKDLSNNYQLFNTELTKETLNLQQKLEEIVFKLSKLKKEYDDSKLLLKKRDIEISRFQIEMENISHLKTIAELKNKLYSKVNYSSLQLSIFLIELAKQVISNNHVFNIETYQKKIEISYNLIYLSFIYKSFPQLIVRKELTTNIIQFLDFNNISIPSLDAIVSPHLNYIYETLFYLVNFLLSDMISNIPQTGSIQVLYEKRLEIENLLKTKCSELESTETYCVNEKPNLIFEKFHLMIVLPLLDIIHNLNDEKIAVVIKNLNQYVDFVQHWEVTSIKDTNKPVSQFQELPLIPSEQETSKRENFKLYQKKVEELNLKIKTLESKIVKLLKNEQNLKSLTFNMDEVQRQNEEMKTKYKTLEIENIKLNERIIELSIASFQKLKSKNFVQTFQVYSAWDKVELLQKINDLQEYISKTSSKTENVTYDWLDEWEFKPHKKLHTKFKNNFHELNHLSKKIVTNPGKINPSIKLYNLLTNFNDTSI